jgi:hypothetical protein
MGLARAEHGDAERAEAAAYDAEAFTTEIP